MKIGTHMSASRNLPASRLLRSIANHLPPEARKLPTKRRRGGACRVSDDDVRAMRREHEEQGTPATDLAQRYQISRDYCVAILQYHTRVKHIL